MRRRKERTVIKAVKDKERRKCEKNIYKRKRKVRETKTRRKNNRKKGMLIVHELVVMIVKRR